MQGNWFNQVWNSLPRAVRKPLSLFLLGLSIGATAISSLLIPFKNGVIEYKEAEIQKLKADVLRLQSGETKPASTREPEIVTFFVRQIGRYEQEIQRLRSQIEVIRLGHRDTSRSYRWIRGRVVEDSGAPIADALVEVGSSHVFSRSNGEFYIPASRGAPVVVSKAGFKTLRQTEWGAGLTQHLVLIKGNLE